MVPLWLNWHSNKLLDLDVIIPYDEFEEDLQDVTNAQETPLTTVNRPVDIESEWQESRKVVTILLIEDLDERFPYSQRPA